MSRATTEPPTMTPHPPSPADTPADTPSRGELEALAWRFDQPGDFCATRAAEAALAGAGFSVGHTQRGEPRGILFGDYDIQKWRNLNRQERAELHGELVGDGRGGPVVVRWRPNMPDDAKRAALARRAAQTGEADCA